MSRTSGTGLPGAAPAGVPSPRLAVLIATAVILTTAALLIGVILGFVAGRAWSVPGSTQVWTIAAQPLATFAAGACALSAGIGAIAAAHMLSSRAQAATAADIVQRQTAADADIAQRQRAAEADVAQRQAAAAAEIEQRQSALGVEIAQREAASAAEIRQRVEAAAIVELWRRFEWVVDHVDDEDDVQSIVELEQRTARSLIDADQASAIVIAIRDSADHLGDTHLSEMLDIYMGDQVTQVINELD